MKNVTVYTSPSCVYCNRAKSLLREKGINFSEIDLASNDGLREELVAKYKWQTVPMIVIGEKFIGGFDDLNKLNLAGELHSMIAAG